MKKLPDDLEQLEGYLVKLKDRELRLEFELALRNNPSIEKVVVDLATAITEVKRIDEEIDGCGKVDEETKRKVEVTDNQIKMLEAKLDHLRAYKQELLTGDERRIRLTEKRAGAVDKFKLQYPLWKQKIEGLESLIPSLNEFLQKNGLDI